MESSGNDILEKMRCDGDEFCGEGDEFCGECDELWCPNFVEESSRLMISEECGNVVEGDLGFSQISPIHVDNVQSLDGNVAHRSPIQTVQTIETVVSTNRVSVETFVEAPRVGMVFKRWQDVEMYYKAYGQQQGFGVSRVQGAVSKTTKERRCTTWRCECWGAPDMRAKREAKKRAKAMDASGSGGNVNGIIGADELSRGKRTSKKCECPAMIYVSVNGDGQWELKKVDNRHDGHTVSPSKSKLVKEYRMKNYTSTVRKRLLKFYEEGVPVSQIHGCLSLENEELPTVKDLQHELQKERRLKMEGGDASAMMAYFERMQADNQNFYHAHRLDALGRLKDVLWVDARSRVAYEDFGDVVCFDATYLTNQYELPFVNFVGVNHHGQSILLGCALVSREDCETYSWVFRQWVACMRNRAPLAILTDQAAAMRKPLAEVMPNSRHRWCIWHIMKKFPEKLGKCNKYTEFKSPLKAVIYESFTVEEFENRWCELIKKYELEENSWLGDLFQERHMWVPAFMKEHFWAGMKTTQRVESINSFFDGFVNRKTKLFEFPMRYTKAMEKRVKDESAADARSSKYVRRLVSGFKLEKFFQKLYTDAKFQEIQIELSRLMYCYDREERVIDERTIQYLLEDRVWIVPEGESEEVITNRRRFYSVSFNPVTKEVSCNCRKFETHGLFCKHCVRILDKNLVFDVAKKYILDRWRKDIVRKHTRVKVAYHDPSHTTEVKRFNKIMSDFEPICDEAAATDDATVELVINSLSKLRVEVKESRKKYMDLVASCAVPSSEYPKSEIGSSSHGFTPSMTNPSYPVRLIELDGAEGEQDIPEFVHISPVLDPVTRKRPRGRPKGIRHKPLSETGYKSGEGTKNKGGNTYQAEVNHTPAAAKIPVKRKCT